MRIDSTVSGRDFFRKKTFFLILLSLTVSCASCALSDAQPVPQGIAAPLSPQTIEPTTHLLTGDPAVTPAADTAPATTSAAVPTPTPTPAFTPTPTPTPVPPTQPASDIDWYDGFADPRTIIPNVVADPDAIDVLVNKYYSIPEDYVPELVVAGSSANEMIRPELANAWDRMRADCESATGYALYLCDGYRTFEEQAALFERSTGRNGIGYCCSKNALEGRSEHNLGLALDISTTDAGEISSGFAETTAGFWVASHCEEYGFIMRYPMDKTMITGYAYEPWHYRYVGIELAAELSEKNLSLEEYYGAIPERLPDA